MREGNCHHGTAESPDPYLPAAVFRVRPAAGLFQMQGQNGQNLGLECVTCISCRNYSTYTREVIIQRLLSMAAKKERKQNE